MDHVELQARMYADLVRSENAAVAAWHETIRRAQTYLGAGLELIQVLEALDISRATWYRRLEAAQVWGRRGPDEDWRLFAPRPGEVVPTRGGFGAGDACEVHLIIDCPYCSGELETIGLES